MYGRKCLCTYSYSHINTRVRAYTCIDIIHSLARSPTNAHKCGYTHELVYARYTQMGQQVCNYIYIINRSQQITYTEATTPLPAVNNKCFKT